jgi:hypothetical protein
MPRSLYPQGRRPGTHWIEDWVGPRTGLDMVSKKKIPIASRYTDWAIPALHVVSIWIKTPGIRVPGEFGDIETSTTDNQKYLVGCVWLVDRNFPIPGHGHYEEDLPRRIEITEPSPPPASGSQLRYSVTVRHYTILLLSLWIGLLYVTVIVTVSQAPRITNCYCKNTCSLFLLVINREAPHRLI